ncbi:hypothetical protein BDV95DRAFT_644126 [Massariosphaeria phaeospora]|uniref:Uncharacterized protein n=1 Tax=Massariosphaeria phaeospora TaxID=100035 RepID=A0A7C8MGT6_9PLEO|nr:hypothetical protein BDV95DRAFT_644126 [Massariosphaeria phaeospora]
MVTNDDDWRPRRENREDSEAADHVRPAKRRVTRASTRNNVKVSPTHVDDDTAARLASAIRAADDRDAEFSTQNTNTREPYTNATGSLSAPAGNNTTTQPGLDWYADVAEKLNTFKYTNNLPPFALPKLEDLKRPAVQKHYKDVLAGTLEAQRNLHDALASLDEQNHLLAASDTPRMLPDVRTLIDNYHAAQAAGAALFNPQLAYRSAVTQFRVFMFELLAVMPNCETKALVKGYLDELVAQAGGMEETLKTEIRAFGSRFMDRKKRGDEKIAAKGFLSCVYRRKKNLDSEVELMREWAEISCRVASVPAAQSDQTSVHRRDWRVGSAARMDVDGTIAEPSKPFPDRPRCAELVYQVDVHENNERVHERLGDDGPLSAGNLLHPKHVRDEVVAQVFGAVPPADIRLVVSVVGAVQFQQNLAHFVAQFEVVFGQMGGVVVPEQVVKGHRTVGASRVELAPSRSRAEQIRVIARAVSSLLGS